MSHPTGAPSWKWPGKVAYAELHDGKVIVSWKGAAQADQAGVDTAVDEYAAHVASLEYRADRAGAYASTGDQLDMQYHDLVNGTTTWKDHVAKVKTDNAKPE
jgi:hypothetical protein|tara:strand:- start:116 stop:421 length:306 start_codon:yes stop_codon:yes gene_type:complete